MKLWTPKATDRQSALQVSVNVLRRAGTSWNLATISDDGLRCGPAPPDVASGLEMERYNERPHPRGRRASPGSASSG